MIRLSITSLSLLFCMDAFAQSDPVAACAAGLLPDTMKVSQNAILEYAFFNSLSSATQARDSGGIEIPIKNLPISLDFASDRAAQLATITKTNLSSSQALDYLISYIPPGARAGFFGCIENAGTGTMLIVLPEKVEPDSAEFRVRFRPPPGDGRYRMVVYSNGELGRPLDVNLSAVSAPRSVYLTWPDPTKSLKISVDVFNDRNILSANSGFTIPPLQSVIAVQGPTVIAQQTPPTQCPGRKGGPGFEDRTFTVTLEEDDREFVTDKIELTYIPMPDRGIPPDPNMSFIKHAISPSPRAIVTQVRCGVWADQKPSAAGLIKAPTVIYKQIAPTPPPAGVHMSATLTQIAPPVTSTP